MNKYTFTFLFVYLIFAGCSGTKGTKETTETTKKTGTTETITKEELSAAHHMNIADSLTTKSAFRKATNEYLLIARQYKTTKYYAEAVYQTAVLYSNPLNPIASDSASLFWFRKSLTLPITEQQKEKANIYIPLLERIVQLRDELKKLREVDVKLNKRGGKK